MRRLNGAVTAGMGDERGVIAPLLALLMTAMLGMAAFVIDTGMMYSEKAQLQNGADAAALAIAQACGQDPLSDTCHQQKAAASDLVGGNALDGFTHFFTPKLDEKNGTVDVEVQTRDAADNKYFSLVFARILGIDTVDIRATAQAKISGYKTAVVLPLTFSTCEAEAGWTKPLQFLPLHGSALSTLCKSKSSGLEVSGGFGWLQDTLQDGKCNLQVVENGDYQSDPGINVPADCNQKFADFEKELAAGKDVEVLVPIFDSVAGKGKDAVFHVEAFAQISLRGWHFGAAGRHYLTPDAQALWDSKKLKPTDTGLIGKYVKKVSTADAAALGGSGAYQVGGVRLTN